MCPRPGAHGGKPSTRPEPVSNYLEQQIGLLMHNHEVPVQIGLSRHPYSGAICRSPTILL